jgi:putative transcriptional regulator
MAKKRSGILDGLEDAVAYAKGDTSRGRKRQFKVPGKVDVKAIRKRQNMSQSSFAEHFGFAMSSIQNWEQNRREPEGAARLLLSIIDAEPAVVRRILKERPLMPKQADAPVASRVRR